MGVPVPDLTAWLVAAAELLGGVALILGAYVAVASVVLIVDMLVAMIAVHAKSAPAL